MDSPNPVNSIENREQLNKLVSRIQTGAIISIETELSEFTLEVIATDTDVAWNETPRTVIECRGVVSGRPFAIDYSPQTKDDTPYFSSESSKYGTPVRQIEVDESGDGDAIQADVTACDVLDQVSWDGR